MKIKPNSVNAETCKIYSSLTDARLFHLQNKSSLPRHVRTSPLMLHSQGRRQHCSITSKLLKSTCKPLLFRQQAGLIAFELGNGLHLPNSPSKHRVAIVFCAIKLMAFGSQGHFAQINIMHILSKDPSDSLS